MSPENASNDILQRKNAFLDYKKKNLIKSRNEHFLKGLVHGFGENFENFLSFYSRQNRPE